MAGGFGIGEFLRNTPAAQGGQMEKMAMRDAEEDAAAARYALERGIGTPGEYGAAAADYSAAADVAAEEGLAPPAMLDANPARIVDPQAAVGDRVPMALDPNAQGIPGPMSDAEHARQYMAQNPEADPITLRAPARGGGGGSPLGGVRRDMREGFEAMGAAQAETARAQAEGQESAAGIVAESRDRIESKQQEMLETMEARQAAQESFARDQQRRQETYQATVANREREIQQDMEELKNAKIDPNNFFRGEDGEIDWGTKVGASIAMALSAMGSALAGGPNLAKEIIDGAIQRDMKAQAANLENQRSALGEKKSALGRYMDRFSDERAAFAATQGSLLQGYADQIAMAKEGIQDQEQLQQLDLLEQQYRTEAQTLITGAAQRQAELDMQAAETEAGLIGQEEGIRTQRTQRAATRQSMAMKRRAAQGGGESGLPPGYEGKPPTQKALNDVVAMAGTGEEALAAIQDLKQHVEKEGIALPFTEADAAGKTKATNLQMIAKDLFELGVLAGPDMELIEKVIPSDPGAFRQGRVKAQLSEAENLVKRKLDNYMKARGVQRTASKLDSARR